MYFSYRDTSNVSNICCTASAAPSNVAVVTTTYNSLSVTWEFDVGDETFSVYYKITGTGDEEAQTSDTDGSPHTITGLSSATSYTLWVVAVKDGVHGSPSDQVTGSTSKIIYSSIPDYFVYIYL